MSRFIKINKKILPTSNNLSCDCRNQLRIQNSLPDVASVALVVVAKQLAAYL
jgi:hypothetical protein